MRPGKESRRDAVLASLVALGGSAAWLDMEKRGHNIATIHGCIVAGLVAQRSPTGPRVFDLTPAGRARAEAQAEAVS